MGEHPIRLVYSASPQSGTGKQVTVASNDELRRRSHAQRLAMATAALGMSRRRFADELARAIYGWDGQVLWPNGSVFEIGETLIDDVFKSDPDFRWLSSFCK